MRPPRFTPERLKVLRYVAIAFSLLSVASVVVVGVLVTRTEMAFDEAHCRFTRVSVRDVAPKLRVADERRQCTPALVEHRWLALRPGKPPNEVGRRRLASPLFTPTSYTWSATPTPSGLVQIHLLFTNPTTRPSLYEELPALPGTAPRN